MKKLIFSALLSIFINAFSYSQTKMYPHSLSMGVVNGVAKKSVVRGKELTTSVVGLDFSHQRNFGESFSFRTSLTYDYVFPTKYEIEENGGFTAPNGRTVLYESSSTLLALQGSPMYYYRDKGFSIYLGLGGGLGLYTQKSSGYFSYDGTSKDEEIYDDKSDGLVLGWRPTFGVSFKIGDSKSPAEVELSLFREAWYSFDFGDSTFSWFGMGMAYRFNFMEG